MRFLVNDGRGFRVDLEGIRGLALLIILSTHLIEWPTGGFVALDLFFVLSGYLITGLLIREHQRTGGIDIAKFYRRRIRRLGPAATLVIVLTVIGGFLIFPAVRAESIMWDGVWAFLLVANWNFVVNGTDYFATWQPQSPLLHYWSLSVEEQFYLVWPAIVLGAIGIGALSSRRRRRSAGGPRYLWVIVVIAFVSAVSFAWGVIQPMTEPQVSYLSTLTRAWELGLGALLFFCNTWWERIPHVLRPVLSWSGVAVLVGAALFLTPDHPYPSVWALLPAVATTGIIVSGVGGDSKLFVATNPVARYLGQISYSGYLWHWPVFVYLAALVGKESPVYLWGAIPLALVLSALAFHLVEDPVRHSSWLEPRRHHRRRRTESQRRRVTIGLRAGAVSALVAAIALVVVVVQLPRDTTEPPAARPSPPPATLAPDDDGPGDPVADIERAVLEALDTDEWPAAVTAQIDSGQFSRDHVFWDECLDTDPETEAECVIGDESLPLTAVVLGDSVAFSWLPGLGAALNDLGYRVRLLTHSLCPFAEVEVTGTVQSDARRAGYPEECNDHRDWARERTLEIQPDLVIASDGEDEMRTLILPSGVGPEEYWSEGLATAADALQGLPLVVITSPPTLISIGECFTRVAVVADCTERISERWRVQRAAIGEAQSLAAHPFEVVDSRLWFCSRDGWCPPFIDETVVRSDRQHITTDYALRLIPVLRASLEDAVAAPATTDPSDSGS